MSPERVTCLLRTYRLTSIRPEPTHSVHVDALVDTGYMTERCGTYWLTAKGIEWVETNYYT